MNLKPRLMTDLMTDQPFTRSDLIYLAGPATTTSAGGRDVKSFAHVKKMLGEDDEKEEPKGDANEDGKDEAKTGIVSEAETKSDVLGIRKDPPSSSVSQGTGTSTVSNDGTEDQVAKKARSIYTSGLAAASVTSTAVMINTNTQNRALTELEQRLQR